MAETKKSVDKPVATLKRPAAPLAATVAKTEVKTEVKAPAKKAAPAKKTETKAAPAKETAKKTETVKKAAPAKKPAAKKTETKAAPAKKPAAKKTETKKGVFKLARVDPVIFYGIGVSQELGVFKARHGMHHSLLYIARQAAAESVGIDHRSGGVLGFQHNMVLVGVGKADDFILYRRTVTNACSLDRATVEG